jgi:CheY-like chemotaxis protein
VLLIEDEPLVRRLLEQLLMRAGYQAVPASDPLEALARVERERQFDLIITDVVMASMSGPELVERIEALRGPMPTIFMSGHTDHEKFRKGRLASNHRFMPKPFAPADLLMLVREVMASTGR